MSDTDRLHEIVDTLPPQQVNAHLTPLAPLKLFSDAEFGRILADAPEEDVDEETAARILAADAEEGQTIPLDELLRLSNL